MKTPVYIDQNEAREVLADIGIILNERQMKRATEPNAHGQRKLPFFIDPVEGRLRIEKDRLLRIYTQAQVEAVNNSLYN